jgi:hypothetical protein
MDDSHRCKPTGHTCRFTQSSLTALILVVSVKPLAQIFQAVDGYFANGLGLDDEKGFRLS